MTDFEIEFLLKRRSYRKVNLFTRFDSCRPSLEL
jgi:hypothetical protein